MVALEELSPREQRGSRPRCLLLAFFDKVAVHDDIGQWIPVYPEQQSPVIGAVEMPPP